MDKLKAFLVPKKSFTFDPAFSSAPELFGTSFATKYLEKAKTPISLSIAFPKGLHKRFLKAKSPNIYCGKIYKEYYNFYQ